MTSSRDQPGPLDTQSIGWPPHSDGCGPDDLPEEAYAAALASIPYLRPPEVARRLSGQSPSAAWAELLEGRRLRPGSAAGDLWSMVPPPTREETDAPALTARARIARSIEVAEVWARHREAGVKVVLPGGPGYPSALADDPFPPAVLFALGDLGALDARPRVGIIGTRRCTHYGREVARSLGRRLSAAGVVVVSGLALGIDGAAHLGVLDGEGAPPVAVVGSGLDRPYPSRHSGLWERVAGRGLLLSEAACGGIPATWRFPFRNRVIAALSDVLVVVESHDRGGSLHTVDAAVERGRTVLVVPGPVSSAASAGTNRLLYDGCGPVRDADDVLVALGLNPAARDGGAGGGDPRIRPDPADAPALAAVGWTATSTDRVVVRTGWSVARVTLALARLEDAGWIRATGGWWERCASW